jgi:N-acetylglucosaminyldiphosphoundecaprenol N-acetyl-beta-D-mannosaminyltransferase
MIEPVKQVSVLGLPVHLAKDYASWLCSCSNQKMGAHVVTLNAEMAMLCEKNKDLAETIKAADLVIPDGAGIVLYLRWKGIKQQRCPGIELAESAIQKLGKSGLICLYGGKPEVVEKAASYWRSQMPEINLITNHGYLTAEEEQQWQKTIQREQPKLILVALGVPRQEFWIRDNRHLCPEAIWIGVGGSFDVWSGIKDRAPSWFRDNNLEWFYRLTQEPWRWHRMLALPKFFLKAFLSG